MLIFSTEFFHGFSYTCSSDYSVYDGRCTYTHLLHATHMFLHIARAQSHLQIFMRVHIHAWLKVMKKVFVACVSSLSISLSPFSCLARLCRSCTLTSTSRTCPSSCRTFPCQKRRTRATPHMHRGVLAAWPSQMQTHPTHNTTHHTTHARNTHTHNTRTTHTAQRPQQPQPQQPQQPP